TRVDLVPVEEAPVERAVRIQLFVDEAVQTRAAFRVPIRPWPHRLPVWRAEDVFEHDDRPNWPPGADSPSRGANAAATLSFGKDRDDGHDACAFGTQLRTLRRSQAAQAFDPRVRRER